MGHDPGAGLIRRVDHGLDDQVRIGLDVEHGAAGIGGEQGAHQRHLLIRVSLIELQDIVVWCDPGPFGETLATGIDKTVVGLGDFPDRVDQANL